MTGRRGEGGAGGRLVRSLLDDPAEAFARCADDLPELAAMRGCPQPVNHHAEGDVAAHTELAMTMYADLDTAVDRYAGATLREAGVEMTVPPRSLTAALAVLLHDVGKPLTIAGRAGAWTYYGHESVGADAAAGLLERVDIRTAAARAGTSVDADTVVWLIRNHLFWLNADVRTVTDRAVARRFVDDPVRGDLLRLVNWCDVLGSRGVDGRPHVEMLVATELRLLQTRRRAAAAAAAPPPLLDGATVMSDVGIAAGPRVGAILRLVRQRFHDEAQARQWLQRNATRLRQDPIDELTSVW